MPSIRSLERFRYKGGGSSSRVGHSARPHQHDGPSEILRMSNEDAVSGQVVEDGGPQRSKKDRAHFSDSRSAQQRVDIESVLGKRQA